ncbi:DUF1289 domain-containing protein [Aestuariirhabdus litorea]|uniref:DUF1289 domain-containing protein n=1 Tax=Aestuariirhabdus litorea TaxID=2528527 RepID=A0A3P3VTJ7_9GAMM|nr:DUF1289 domain-containing protein [Aestuariirhabdus litorea]RRJ85288.1 DUF1289 domain-containing protein [Aestuariirhabdus litorea]RWW98509.1 DUF1289 domain-containing protein [Endozoicomonadaceae bacterium GTF-13]
MDKSPVASPCVSICALNEEDICIGCYRTDQEIMRWREMGEEEKRQVVRMANQRAVELGRSLAGSR